METKELDLLTESEAAELLLMSPKTLQKRRFTRKPPTYINLNGTIRYRLGDLEDYLQKSAVVLLPQENGDDEE